MAFPALKVMFLQHVDLKHIEGAGNHNMRMGSDERIGHAPCRSFTMTMPHLTLLSSPSISCELQNGCHPPPTVLP
jgi:hypothetical protein